MIKKETVIEALKKVFDPEIQIDVWTLGLIYDIIISKDKVNIKMTLTSPMCPYGPQLLSEVEQAVKAILGVKAAKVELVFEPAWEPSEDTKLQLGL